MNRRLFALQLASEAILISVQPPEDVAPVVPGYEY